MTFNEPVRNVQASDFTANFTGASASVASVTAMGSVQTAGGNSYYSTYAVVVDDMLGSGTLGLTLNDNDSIVDENGVPLGGPGLGNGSFSSGATCAIVGAANISIRAASPGFNATSNPVAKWDTTTHDWRAGSPDGPLQAWNDGSDAYFAGSDTAIQITVSGSPIANSMSFADGNFTLEGRIDCSGRGGSANANRRGARFDRHDRVGDCGQWINHCQLRYGSGRHATARCGQ